MVIIEEKLQPLHHGLPTWSCARPVLRTVSSAGGVLMALLLWRNVLVRFCHSHWISRWNHWMALFPNRLQNPPVQRWAGCAQLWSLCFVFFSSFFLCAKNSMLNSSGWEVCMWLMVHISKNNSTWTTAGGAAPRFLSDFVLVPQPLCFWTYTYLKPELGPPAQAAGREQSAALYAQIHLIVFPKSLSLADLADYWSGAPSSLHQEENVCWWR